MNKQIIVQNQVYAFGSIALGGYAHGIRFDLNGCAEVTPDQAEILIDQFGFEELEEPIPPAEIPEFKPGLPAPNSAAEAEALETGNQAKDPESPDPEKADACAEKPKAKVKHKGKRK